MLDSPDYRLYLESEFKGLHSLVNAQFETIHDRLEKIEEQTTKTNGTVAKHETFITGLEAVEKNSSMGWNRIFQIVGVLIALGMFTIAYMNLTKRIDNTESELTGTIRREIRSQEGISKVTRGGYVKYNEMGLSDSVKIR